MGFAANLKAKVSRRSSSGSETESEASPQSSYMGEHKFDPELPQEGKMAKFSGALTRGFQSAKYATVRSAKGIKISVQEQSENLGSKVKSVRTSKKGGSLLDSAVPSV